MKAHYLNNRQLSPTSQNSEVAQLKEGGFTMAYVPTDDLKRLSRMTLLHCEIEVQNYCFANNLDEPDDFDDVCEQVLQYFGKEIASAKSS